jgi:hypothetical protein
MRTLGFRTHVLLALAAAVGLVASLSRPWYAATPPPVESTGHIGDINGPLTGFWAGVERWISANGGSTAWDSLDYVAIALAAMAALAGLGALASLWPRTQVMGREAVRYGSLVAAGIVIWRMVDSPGPNDAMELRYGAFVALGTALMLVSCGSEIGNSPLRGRRKPAPYTAPPAPAVPVYDTGSSTGPPAG